MLRIRIAGVSIWFIGVVSILTRSPVPPNGGLPVVGLGFGCWVQVLGLGFHMLGFEFCEGPKKERVGITERNAAAQTKIPLAGRHFQQIPPKHAETRSTVF